MTHVDPANRFPAPPELLRSHLAQEEYQTLLDTNADKITRTTGQLTVTEYRDFDDRLQQEIGRLEALKVTVIALRTLARAAVTG